MNIGYGWCYPFRFPLSPSLLFLCNSPTKAPANVTLIREENLSLETATTATSLD